MTILAKAIEGKEFLYNPRSAHEVSKAGADYIVQVLNEYRYQLKDGEVWHVYEIDEYDQIAYVCACGQKFTRRKGIVKEFYNI